MDRHPTRLGELPVDLAHEVLDLQAQIVVLGNILAARHDLLDERDPLMQFRIPVQGVAERNELVGNALGVIQAIDTEDHLPATQVLAEVIGKLADRVRGGAIGETLEIDADRERPDPDLSRCRCRARAFAAGALDPHIYHLPLTLHRDAPYQGTRALEEVTPITQGLKTDQIELEQTPQDLEAPRQLQENVQRWERDVEEETESALRTHVAQLARHLHQVIVMHPDEVTGLGAFREHR